MAVATPPPVASGHGKIGEFEITVGIEDGVVKGEFPRRALRHVMEWSELHERELRDNWDLAQERKRLRPIAPLE